MHLIDKIILTLLLLFQILLLVIFIYRLKYVKEYGLSLLGVLLIIDIVFTGLSELARQFIFPNISAEIIATFNSNIILLFEFGIILLIYSKFNEISKKNLSIIYFLFSLIWLIEFVFNNLGRISLLSYSSMFLRVATVSLTWLYLINLYKKPVDKYTSVPFFWISIGWLVYYSITASTYTPHNVENEIQSDSKPIIFYIITISGFITTVCYAIGFWKTKDWILKNDNQ